MNFVVVFERFRQNLADVGRTDDGQVLAFSDAVGKVAELQWLLENTDLYMITIINIFILYLMLLQNYETLEPHSNLIHIFKDFLDYIPDYLVECLEISFSNKFVSVDSLRLVNPQSHEIHGGLATVKTSK